MWSDFCVIKTTGTRVEAGLRDREVEGGFWQERRAYGKWSSARILAAGLTLCHKESPALPAVTLSPPLSNVKRRLAKGGNEGYTSN